MAALYDRIGAGYTLARQPDPRIAARIHAALGDTRSVVNVGAGAGSYEPHDRAVVAVEPSAAMIGQRETAASAAVRGVAGYLPFRADSFDAAMATLTMHHWPDWRQGVAEMRRVARERVVILTFDPQVSHRLWLAQEYLPGIRGVASDSFSFDEVAQEVGGEAEVVPVPWDCFDGFLAAYWRRPERYLEPEVRAGISAFHSLPEDEVEAGLERLRADITSGEWAARHAALVAAEEFDGGYRLLVAEV
jgi:SAM-dependent methyltransferase